MERIRIKTVTGKTKWQATVIMKMLRNEKYMGDALLQKTYTADFMTKKKVINNGIVPQYYSILACFMVRIKCPAGVRAFYCYRKIFSVAARLIILHQTMIVNMA